METEDAWDVPEFGDLDFDRFVIEEWDPDSILPKHEQNRVLVERWIRLGQAGRMPYSCEEHDLDQDTIPPHVPRDLLSASDRASQYGSVIWIRTWFGDKDDKASQHAADEAYKRLSLVALQDNNENGCLRPELHHFLIYESKDEFSADGWDSLAGREHFKNGVALATPGSVPSYVVTAAMHFPDQFRPYPTSDAELEELDEDPCAKNTLVLVADRIACEQGWVLQFAINHRGAVLPCRMRDIARDTMYCEGHWADGFGEDDEEYYYLADRRASGWDRVPARLRPEKPREGAGNGE